MDVKKVQRQIEQKVINYIKKHKGNNIFDPNYISVYIMFFCETPGYCRWLLDTDIEDGRYFEAIWNVRSHTIVFRVLQQTHFEEINVL